MSLEKSKNKLFLPTKSNKASRHASPMGEFQDNLRQLHAPVRHYRPETRMSKATFNNLFNDDVIRLKD